MMGVTLLLAAAVSAAGAAADEAALIAADAFPALDCVAEQTGGFHDYPDDADGYQPALFNSVPFRLEENAVFMLNLAPETGIDRYLTLTAGDDPVTTELECRQVRGVDGSLGFSCVNIPPSEMLLIHAGSLRFTRTAVGGWTFAGAAGYAPGDSIFVEYGTCRPAGG
ncbi:MAG: hypothetical protein RLO46_03035 [Pseudomonadales bacterium]